MSDVCLGHFGRLFCICVCIRLSTETGSLNAVVRPSTPRATTIRSCHHLSSHSTTKINNNNYIIVSIANFATLGFSFLLHIQGHRSLIDYLNGWKHWPQRQKKWIHSTHNWSENTHTEKKCSSIISSTHPIFSSVAACIWLQLIYLACVENTFFFSCVSVFGSVRTWRVCVWARGESTEKPQKPLGWTHRGNQQEKNERKKTQKCSPGRHSDFSDGTEKTKTKTKLVYSLFSHRVYASAVESRSSRSSNAMQRGPASAQSNNFAARNLLHRVFSGYFSVARHDGVEDQKKIQTRFICRLVCPDISAWNKFDFYFDYSRTGRKKMWWTVW